MIITLKELLELCKTPELYNYVKEQMIGLYNQLSPCSEILDGKFQSFVMHTNPILCIGDNFKILGTVSVLFDYKIIHNGGVVCRFEDFVVDEEHRNQGVGTQLIERAKSLAVEKGAYKIILDCKTELEGFYMKHGFNNRNIQMSIYY